LTNLTLLGNMRLYFSWGIMSPSLKGETHHHMIVISSRNGQLSLILQIASWSSTFVQLSSFLRKYFKDWGKLCLKSDLERIDRQQSLQSISKDWNEMFAINAFMVSPHWLKVLHLARGIYVILYSYGLNHKPLFIKDQPTKQGTYPWCL